MTAPRTPNRFTRVTLFLPVNTIDEITAATRIRSVLVRRYMGATASLFQPPILRGYWRSGRRVYTDEIAMVTVDIARDLNEAAVLQELEALRVELCDIYRQAGSPQEVIWLTAHAISGFVNPCPAPNNP